MKKIFKFLCKCTIVLIIVFLAFELYSNYLDKKINELYEKNIKYVNHINGLSQKDKGNILIENSLLHSKMLIMGSSELSSPVPENLKNLFPNDLYDGDISLVGQASVQNALHAINLGSNFNSIESKDVMIIESLQWFMNDDINIQGFFSNFSELQFYEFLHNNMIKEENKQYLCKRYIELENKNILHLKSKFDLTKHSLINNVLPDSLAYGSLTNKQTYILARLYSTENFAGKMLYQIMRPYYWMRYKVLSIKDKYQAYKWLKTLDGSLNNKKTIDWNEMYSKGEEEGKKACTNNDLYVYDDYYTTYLKDKWDNIKNTYSNVKLLDSNEWNDFKFFLDVCRDLGIKPYITIMSTNGWYYDYTGMTKETRDEYYDKVNQMAKELGFDVLNLKDYEYTPYFYCDVMHLGWKGWPYVIQNTIEHFSK